MDAKRSAETANLDSQENGAKVQRIGGFPALDGAVLAKVESIYASGRMKQGDLDAQALGILATELPPSSALEVLNQFESSDLPRVRNKSAYLCGCISRYRKANALAGPAHTRSSSRYDLEPEVVYALERLYASGKASPKDIDVRCMEYLVTVPVSLGVHAIEVFGSKDLSNVRNVAALFMSTLKSIQDRDFRRVGRPHHFSQHESHEEHSGGADKHFWAVEHGLLGLRVEEFHRLSVWSPYVHPAPALRLQQLWDEGVRLVALLDDRAWEVLSLLGPAEAIAVIDEVAEVMMTPAFIRNVSAFFMVAARHFLDETVLDGRLLGMHPPPSMSISPPVMFPPQPLPGRSASRNPEYRPGRDPTFFKLAGPLRQKIEELLIIQSGLIRPSHFDEVLVEQLDSLGLNDAIAVVEEVMAYDLTEVRNVTAYVVGIIKRYREALRRQQQQQSTGAVTT